MKFEDILNLKMKNKVKLIYKLLLLSVSIALISIIFISMISFNKSKSALEKVSYAQLESMKSVITNRIENYFDKAKIFTGRLAKDRLIEGMFIAYEGAFYTDGFDEGEDLNINGESYVDLDSLYGERVNKLTNDYDLSNFILITDDSQVVFSAKKDVDGHILGRSFSDGALKDSQLAKCFRDAMASDSGEIIFSDYEFISTAKKTFAFLCVKQVAEFDHTSEGIKKGELIGAVIGFLDLNMIDAIASQREGMGKTGHSYIVGSDKKLRSTLFTDKKKYNLNNIFQNGIGYHTDVTNNVQIGKDGIGVADDLLKEEVLFAYGPLKAFDKHWTIISEIRAKEVFKPVSEMLTIVFVSALSILLFVILISIFLAKAFTRPIGRIISMFGDIEKAIMKGDLSIRGEADKINFEFRPIIVGLNGIIDNLLKPTEEANQVLSKMAKGDLSDSMTGDYQGDSAKLQNALNQTISSIKDLIAKVQVTVSQVTDKSHQVASASQALSQGATEQASSIEEISSSMHEIGSQTKQNASNAQSAKGLSDEANKEAQNGNAHMDQVIQAMTEINQSSEDISKIIKVIDEIAFQTNLLALNAAVEAARAGKHGKGFAVVAEEVRNLAERSAKAAKETTDLIEDSSKKVEFGTQVTEKTASALKEIMQGSTKVTDLVGDISTASDEQANGISQIVMALGQVDQVTQKNTASAEECASASSELSNDAKALRGLVEEFKLNK